MVTNYFSEKWLRGMRESVCVFAICIQVYNDTVEKSKHFRNLMFLLIKPGYEVF
jgi:hypothetical protein